MRKIVSVKRLLCFGIACGGIAACPALADETSVSWNGPYAGGFVGGAWSDFRNNSGTPGPSGSDGSFTGGVDAGNNWQFDCLVVGIEGDISKLDNHSGSSGIKFDEDGMATLRGRLGFAYDRFLPYVTGGVAGTDTVYKVSGVGSAGKIQPSYVVGGGIDAMISGNWFARVEYLYANVPKDSQTIGGTTVAGGSGNNIAQVGLNYKF